MKLNLANGVILAQLAIDYALKLQEIGNLFRNANTEGRDVTDEEVSRSKVSRDVQLAKTASTVGAG
jgi:hypothetical protein